MEKSIADEPVAFYGTLEDYFALEATSPLRHEYHGAGRIVAMAGGSADHARICINVSAALWSRVAGRPCEAFNESMRIKVSTLNKFYFPDASAVCDGAQIAKDAKGIQSLTNPQVIIEVLSPSTAKADRGSKFDDYSTIESLTEYVLLEQDEPRATVLTRRAGGPWQFVSVAGLEATLSLASVGVEISMREVYRNVVFETQTSQPITEMSCPPTQTAKASDDPAAAGIAGPGDQT